MTQRLILFSAFLVFGILKSNAQTPRSVQIEKIAKQADGSALKILACDNQFAGTLNSVSPVTAQSNDVDLDTMYLCFGDEVLLNHNHDADLTDDPTPATPPGIGYVFYDCAPTASGPNLTAIQNDPCTNTTSPIFIGGNLVNQRNGVWIASEFSNGDLNLRNDGTLIQAFGGGLPVQFWFAPITLDDFINQGFYQDPVTREVGPCVHANVNEAFRVVYLNRISAVGQSVSDLDAGCRASFIVSGGFPQFRNGANYTISITKDNQPNVIGTIDSAPATHGSTVEFTVPGQGVYNITIEDGKSCGTTFQMDLTACNGISITSSNEVVPSGSRVCVDVSVRNFVDILSTQYTISWDPNILSYDGIEFVNPPIPGLNISSFGESLAGNGILSVSWDNPDFFQGLTLPAGHVIFRVCFIAVGQNGEQSPVIFSGDITEVEIRNSLGAQLGFENSPIGRVFISDSAIVTEVDIDTTCFGVNEAGFTLRIFGGTPPYSFFYRDFVSGTLEGPFMINSSGGSFTISNQAPGNYEISISDNSFPPATSLFIINLPARARLTANVDPLQEIQCTGEQSGALRVTPLLNNTPVANDAGYTYLWSTGAVTSTITGLAAGLYSVTVFDPFGCQHSSNYTLRDQPPITITGRTTDATCSGRDDGLLEILFINGGNSATGNYNIQIYDPEGLNIFNQSNNRARVTNVVNGDYDIVITDDNGCVLDTFLTIGAVKQLSVNVVVKDNVNCFGGSDGQIFVQGVTNPGPASLPYVFQWQSVPPVPPGNITNLPTSSNISNLRARDYRLIMSDVDGCRFDTTFTITQPDSIHIQLVNKVDETCTPGNDGSATVTVSGGTMLPGSPYNYAWGVPGVNGPSVSGLSAGDYVLTVTDNNMCVDSFAFRINSPNPPVITSLENDTLPCAVGSTGALTVVAVSSGSPITNYTWSNGDSGPNTRTVSSLSPGTYYVTVTAQDGCTAIDSALVVAPAAIAITDTIITGPTCPGDQNGSIIIFINGGTTPYAITWSDAPASPGQPVKAGLSAGTYTVTVTDANNCPAVIQTYVINDPPTIDVDVLVTDSVSCFQNSCDGGATASAVYSNGAAGSFNFIWSSGESDMSTTSSMAMQLCQGIQTVTVNDGSCGVIVPVNVPSRPAIQAALNVTSVSCFGLSDGSATVVASGGSGSFSYMWSNTASGPTASGLAAGNYTVTITDSDGCPFSTNVVITQPSALVASVDAQNTFDVRCSNGSDGQISIITTGGNPGSKFFNWQNNVAPLGSSIAASLEAGTYSVTVTDSRGCEDVVTHVINEPPPIVFAVDSIPPILCFGFTTSVTLANVSGGNGSPYSYSIDGAPVQDISFPTNIFAGQHTITVYDNLNCATELDVNIQQPNPIIINIDPVIEVELGDSTRLQPRFIPGGPPINFDSIFWNPSEYLSCDRCPDPVVRPYENREYTVTVYDINGCEGFATVLVDVDKNRNVYLPNAFSPNGDGINDEFRIYTGPGVRAINYARVFDRWGNLIYELLEATPDPSGVLAWDGNFRGKPLDPAVFVYLIEVTFEDDLVLLYRGDITLMR